MCYEFLNDKSMIAVLVDAFVIGEGAEHYEKYAEWSYAFMETSVFAISLRISLKSNLFVGFIYNDIDKLSWLES